MGDADNSVLNPTFSGIDLLGSVDGDTVTYPPIRVLFLAHRVGGTGLMVVRTATNRIELHLTRGQIDQGRGFPDLLQDLGVKGEPADDMTTLLSRAMGQSIPPHEAIAAMSSRLGECLVRELVGARGRVQFDREVTNPTMRLPLSASVPVLVSQGLRRLRSDEDRVIAFKTRLRHRPVLLLPNDAPETRWGLDPVTTRMIREAERARSLHDLLAAMSGPNAPAARASVELALTLGLLTLEPVAGAEPVESDPPRAAPRSLGPAPSLGPGRASREPAPPPPRSAPPRPPLDAQAVELQSALAAMQGQPPAAILELKKAADITEAGIERAYREVSKRFHPDLLGRITPAARELAQQCFSRVSEAHAALQSAAGRDEAIARLKAEAEGKAYVTESERKRARIAFAKGELLSRNRKWEEALPELEQAAKLDPNEWRYHALSVEASAQCGRMSAKEADERLLALKAPTPIARADLLCTAGELLLRDGQEELAYKRFKEALVENPEHAGARRRVWLKQRREAAEPEKEKEKEKKLGGGLLDSLFKRRKS